MTEREYRREIMNQYYEKLESEGVDYTLTNDLGEGYTESFIKEDYLVSNDAMAQYLGFRDFTDWAWDFALKLDRPKVNYTSDMLAGCEATDFAVLLG